MVHVIHFSSVRVLHCDEELDCNCLLNDRGEISRDNGQGYKKKVRSLCKFCRVGLFTVVVVLGNINHKV